MWTKGEPGPKCHCGKPTVVVDYGEGFALMCFFHTPAEGALYRLGDKPEWWPSPPSLPVFIEYMESCSLLREE